MRKNQSSLTASGIGLVRAIESEKPEDVLKSSHANSEVRSMNRYCIPS
ncbi:MAG TPA: hypothetical protein VMT46_12945 [Anaerolineaceae bacterium]|nr:hypothetical protein [Anaerolineaceae bacterium]